MSTNQQNTNKGQKLGSYIYPVRIIGYLLAISSLLIFQKYHPKENLSSWALYGFCIFLLIYPHLGFLYYRSKGFQRKAEFKTLLMDMFLIGWINFFLDFSPIYGLPFFISNSATNYATAGPKLFGNGVLAFLLACALSLSFDFVFHLEFNLWISIPSFTYLLLATHYIGFISHSKGSTVQKVKLILEYNYQKLEQQQEEIQEKNQALETAQKDIEEGMSYAYGIQKAILPPDEEIRKIFPDYMVLFRPRDIISGDFYWLYQTGSLKILIVADCTGHGVPGAFMGLIGQTFLNQIIIEKRNHRPDKILETLHQRISSFLNQKSNSNQDGMDVSVICFDTDKNTITFAAAKQSLIMIQGNKSKIIRGSLQGVGGELYKTSFKFENQTFTIESTTRLYLFSDGISDQFGGKKNKKLSKNGFMQTISGFQNLAMEEQSAALEQFLNNWINEGSEKQIDDIVVFGIEISPS